MLCEARSTKNDWNHSNPKATGSTTDHRCHPYNYPGTLALNSPKP